MDNRITASEDGGIGTRPVASPSLQAAAIAGKDFFGKDGLTLRDIADALNPLEHIPFLSTLFDSAMEHKPSMGAKVLGSAILGPLGLVACLGNAIFEQQTGHDMGGAVIAALNGEELPQATTQLADAGLDVPLANAVAAEAKPANARERMQIAQLGANAQRHLQPAVASLTPNITPAKLALNDAAAPDKNAVLSLYGASPTSAHQSYQKAQLLPYLQDVTHSRVL